ncbi:MAG: hypothetical protein OXS47_01370 [Chloroflexota bacterium]|nr:hypothetical protein [Chloroflexota bacterium]
MSDWAIALGSSLGGALIGGAIVALLTQSLSDRSERRRLRRDVLRDLAGHRYLLTDQFKGSQGRVFVALNEVAVAYLDDEAVMDALREFTEDIGEGFKAEHLYKLMHAMAAAAGLPADSLDRRQVEMPFAPPE